MQKSLLLLSSGATFYPEISIDDKSCATDNN